MNDTNDPATASAARWLAQLDRALAHGDLAAAVALFGDECYWRDLVAFTWNIVTLESRDAIWAMLAAMLPAIQPAGWTLTEPATTKDGIVEGWFRFETAVGRGRGIFRLRDGRCWTLLTTLQELKGFEEPAGPRTGHTQWRGPKPQNLAGKPYLPFPDHWPVFSPKDKIADWLEMYTRVMELNYWSSTLCHQAAYDEAAQEWTVAVERAGAPVVLKPKQLVLATGGALSAPRLPALPGAESFTGVQQHSSRFRSGEDWTGKRCIVLGFGTSAHDICADLWEHGADVTMIQRASTTVVKTDYRRRHQIVQWGQHRPPAGRERRLDRRQ